MSRILDALRKVDSERSETGPQVEPLPEVRQRREHKAAASVPAVPQAPAAPARPSWGVEPALSEDFRRELSALRLQIESALAGRRPRVVMLCSATRGEGTTTVASSLAQVLVQDGASRVLLVDANARRPGVGARFGIGEGPGLVDVLHAGATFDSVVHPAGRDHLEILSASRGEAIGGHLYAQQMVRGFLGQIGARYDWILFDAPPVLESPETSVLGGVVDTSLLVVRAGSTKSGVLLRAVDALAKASVPVLGLVLNRRRLDIPEFIYRRI